MINTIAVLLFTVLLYSCGSAVDEGKKKLTYSMFSYSLKNSILYCIPPTTYEDGRIIEVPITFKFYCKDMDTQNMYESLSGVCTIALSKVVVSEGNYYCSVTAIAEEVESYPSAGATIAVGP